MKNEIDRLYLIDRYLKGELTGLTLDEFRTKMRMEPNFALEVESHRAIVEGIKLARKEHLKAILSGEAKIKEIKVSESTDLKIEKPLEDKSTKVEDNSAPQKTVPLIPLTKEVKENIPTKDENIFKTSKDLEKRFEEKVLINKPLKLNYNNWYYAAAAVLFAGFFLYFIFGYYIPKEQKIVTIQPDSSKISQRKLPVKDKETSQTMVKEKNRDQDSINTSQDSPEVLIMDETLVQDDINDSIKVATDKKLREKRYMVPAYERIVKNDSQSTKNNSNVSNSKDTEIKNKMSVAKVNGTNFKIEYWNSVVGFKGYKLTGNVLRLFDVDESENIGFTIVDDELYMKRAGSVFKLQNTGNFEQYKKVTNPELLKIIQNN